MPGEIIVKRKKEKIEKYRDLSLDRRKAVRGSMLIGARSFVAALETNSKQLASYIALLDTSRPSVALIQLQQKTARIIHEPAQHQTPACGTTTY